MNLRPKPNDSLRHISGRAFLCALFAVLFFILSVEPARCADTVNAINSSGSQNISLAVDPSDPAKGYLAVLYSNVNGLPTSEANAIAQTGDGFLWIGSYSGLIRYDGSTFERMDSSSGVANVITLYTDSRDRLWIGTNDSGVFMMERDELKNWNTANGMKSTSIRAISEDENGMIHVATTSGIFLIDSGLNLTALNDSRLATASVRDLRLGNDGLIYGLTQAGDLFTLRDGSLVTFIHNKLSRVKGVIAILPDPEKPGNLYLGTEDSTVYYGSLEDNLTSIEAKDISPLSYVDRFEYIDGKIWICTRNGIGCMDGQGLVCLNNLPMNNSVGHVMTDYEGNLWFTSTRQGVMKIVANRFVNVFDQSGLQPDVVNSTCVSRNLLFIATDSGLKVIDNHYHREVDRLPLRKAMTSSGEVLEADDLLELLSGVRIRSVIRDSRGRIWISAWRKLGLLCYDQDELTVYTPSKGLFSDRVRTVYEREDGAMLVATTGGVNVIRNGRVIASYGKEEGIANTEVLTVVSGFQNDIVLGTDGGGIYIIDSEETRHIGIEDGLSSEVVLRVKRDNARGIYWIVTSNALAYMTADYKVIPLNNFPYSNNFDLFENSRGETWVISNNGIYVLPTEELLANGEMKPLHYSVSNGLPCIATANSYSELTSDGELYLSGNTGVAQINIEDSLESRSDLKMAVPCIRVDGKQMYPDETGNYTVPSGTRRLTIRGYVFNYSLSDPQVSYILEGSDTNAVTVRRSELTSMDYMNLPGGTYRFVMELMDSMGLPQKTLSFQIVKEKAFYEQFWFYAVVGLLAALLIAAAVRLYINRKMRLMEEKNREQAEKDRIEGELKMANQIQSGMLPHVFPPFPDRTEFDLFASMNPAKEVGGDFYDFFLLDHDHLCLVIADVSGKGVPAALFMMNAKSVIQSTTLLEKSAAGILKKANDALCANNQADMFVTVWLGILEISTGRIAAANAGHEYPVMRRANEKYELIRDRHGMPAGAMEGIRYREYELQMRPGDKLFLYTDGVPEATDANEQMFGTERMLEALNRTPDASPEQTLINVRAAVDGFVRDAVQFDDLTMMCLEYKGCSPA